MRSELSGTYRGAGFTVVETSAVTGEGVDELRSVIGEPDISVDDVKTELVPKAACFSVEGEFELTYYLYGSQKNMVGSVYGKYGVGLLTYMIEYVD